MELHWDYIWLAFITMLAYICGELTDGNYLLLQN